VEGGYNEPGQPANNWVDWERSGQVEPSGAACGFWHEPEQALDRAAGLGCNAFGLSLEWARVEPEDGEVDHHALDRYGSILSMCVERRLEPVVTLHDFTHPWFLGEEFWMAPGSPERFATHARRIVAALSPQCRHWITINEPNAVAIGGWITGTHPPGRHGALSDAAAVLDNLLTAHVLAYRAIKEEQPGARVTVSVASSSVYDLDARLIDLLCAPSLAIGREALGAWFEERRALHDFAEPPHGLGALLLRRALAVVASDGRRRPGAAGRIARRQGSPRRVLEVLYERPDQRPLDAIGTGWHSAPRRVAPLGTVRPRPSVGEGLARAVLPDPDGLERRVHEREALVPDVPIWVLDHGPTRGARAGLAGRAVEQPDGAVEREQRLRDELTAATAALADDRIDLYLYRRLVDGYERGRHRAGVGLFGMDRGSDGRSAKWLESDAAGIDAPGAFRDMITAVRSAS